MSKTSLPTTFEHLLKENIISAECFQVWLASRTGPVRNPQQLFRKVVVCHIRGINYAPFSADVETSLLKTLRDQIGPCSDPFEQCFSSVEKSTKVKKYKSWKTRYKNLIGYHESRRKMAVVKHEESKKPCSLFPFSEDIAKLLGMKQESFRTKFLYAKKHGVNFSLPALKYVLDQFSAIHPDLSPASLLLTPSKHHFSREGNQI
eukprot:snap_masked-scaffold_1-processed-gene-28.6-mRNA-1 protein AED:1.00 eAED:1.00 QI:0/0/0/0/1/1/3/0/203